MSKIYWLNMVQYRNNHELQTPPRPRACFERQLLPSQSDWLVRRFFNPRRSTPCRGCNTKSGRSLSRSQSPSAPGTSRSTAAAISCDSRRRRRGQCPPPRCRPCSSKSGRKRVSPASNCTQFHSAFASQHGQFIKDFLADRFAVFSPAPAS